MKYVVDFEVKGKVSIVVDTDNTGTAIAKAEDILKQKINNDEFTVSICEFVNEDVRRVVQ